MRPRQLWRAAAAAGVAAVFVLPYAALTAKQKGATHWITVNWQSLERYPHDLVGTKSLAVLIFALALLGIWRSWRDSRAYAVLLVTWAIVPPIVIFAGGQRLHLFLFRYFLFTLPAWVLLAAAGAAALGSLAFRSISDRRRRAWAYGVGAAVVVSVVVLTGLTAQQLYRLDPLEGTYPDFRAAALTVVANQQPGDGIAYGGNSSPRRAFLYEMRTYTRPRDLFLAKTAAQVGQYRAVECTDTASCVGPLPHRIWLVSDSRGKDPLGGLTPAVTKLFTANYQVQHVYTHTGLHVVLLVRKTSG
jgi:mannosyltransferase